MSRSARTVASGRDLGGCEEERPSDEGTEVGGGLATISTETTTATVQSSDYEARERDAYCIK